jgi:hypothetical protein
MGRYYGAETMIRCRTEFKFWARMIRWPILVAAIGLLIASSSFAQDVPRSFQCGKMDQGAYLGAPDWSVHPDANSGQTVLIEYRGSQKQSRVAWFRDGAKYHDAVAVGGMMNSGIWLFAVGESYVETYVLNVSTSELLFTSVRSGSSAYPNAVKAFRGLCVPAGHLSR